ncbi:MAG: hypothetical protein NTY98_03750 [Verrucomicrobia bacterium]|nr:hypothetical protein [Verrucomicrobiota bacterium]
MGDGVVLEGDANLKFGLMLVGFQGDGIERLEMKADADEGLTKINGCGGGTSSDALPGDARAEVRGGARSGQETVV